MSDLELVADAAGVLDVEVDYCTWGDVAGVVLLLAGFYVLLVIAGCTQGTQI